MREIEELITGEKETYSSLFSEYDSVEKEIGLIQCK
jgi:hypothetical protein